MNSLESFQIHGDSVHTFYNCPNLTKCISKCQDKYDPIPECILVPRHHLHRWAAARTRSCWWPQPHDRRELGPLEGRDHEGRAHGVRDHVRRRWDHERDDDGGRRCRHADSVSWRYAAHRATRGSRDPTGSRRDRDRRCRGTPAVGWIDLALICEFRKATHFCRLGIQYF